MEAEIRFVFAKVGGRVGKLGEDVQKMQTSSCQMRKFWGCNVQHGSYNEQYWSVYLRVAKTVA